MPSRKQSLEHPPEHPGNTPTPTLLQFDHHTTFLPLSRCTSHRTAHATTHYDLLTVLSFRALCKSVIHFQISVTLPSNPRCFLECHVSPSCPQKYNLELVVSRSINSWVPDDRIIQTHHPSPEFSIGTAGDDQRGRHDLSGVYPWLTEHLSHREEAVYLDSKINGQPNYRTIQPEHCYSLPLPRAVLVLCRHSRPPNGSLISVETPVAAPLVSCTNHVGVS